MAPSRLARRTSQRVALLGLPFDHNSSHERGAAGAPALVREALASAASNGFAESGVDARDPQLVLDLGDVVATPEASHAAIVETVDAVLAAGMTPISIGGDHAVTWPVLQAVARHVGDLTLLHVDAHPDLYEEFDGTHSSRSNERTLRTLEWFSAGLPKARARKPKG